MELTLEQFLREKLESEIGIFGDGTTEFHTRDLQQLLCILDKKDEKIQELLASCQNLMNMVNFKAEAQLKELLTDCMTINNLSAEERLRYIRKQYKEMYEKISQKSINLHPGK